MRVTRLVLLLAVTAVALTVASPSQAAGLPTSMAALGDSLTTAYGASGAAGNAPAESWSTGTDSGVLSHYLRLLAQSPGISGNAHNDALDGTNMALVYDQTAAAVAQGARYVTVWAGTNDVCTPSTAGMTTVSSFSFSLDRTLTALNAGLPGVQIYVLTIPNWVGMWQNFQSSPTAQSAWAAFPNRCPTVFGATSTPADRAAVAQRTVDLNTAIASVCSSHTNCTTDGGAAYQLWTTLTAADFTFDFFHLSPVGQAKVAAASWGVGPWIGPGNTALPQVTGTATEGQSLTTTDGTWTNGAVSYDYQWKRCNTEGKSCTAIPGATAKTYALQSADVATTIRVDVTASSATGAFTVATSAPTGVVSAAGGSGSFIGQATIGSIGEAGGANYLDSSGPYTLPVSGTLGSMKAYVSGGTTDTPLRVIVYRDDGSGKPGQLAAATQQVVIAAGAAAGWVTFPFAIAPTLTPGSYWLGYWYGQGNALEYFDRVVGAERFAPATYSATGSPPATYGNSNSSASSFSIYVSYTPATGLPANTDLPGVSGDATEGQTLTATPGTWNGAPTGFAYQWRRCDSAGGACTDIAGATQQSYLLVTADVGSTMRVRVTATNGNGSASAVSAPTSAVQAQSGPASTLGRTTPGTSSLTGGTNFLDVSGPYTLSTTSVLSKLTGYVGGGADTSALRAVVYADDGTGEPGSLVAVTSEVLISAGQAAGWVDLPFASMPTVGPGDYWIGWWIAFPGASRLYYDVDTGAERYQFSTYLATGNPPSTFGSSPAATSGWSIYATYLPSGTAPVASSAPTVSGSTTVGQTLTANPGSWTGTPTLAYQWRRCDAGGAGCVSIASATAATYTLTAGDAGHTMRARVTATNSGGSTVATTDATGVVQEAGPQQTFGNTTAGVVAAGSGANFLDVSGPYNVPVPAAISKLTGYVGGGAESTPLRAIIYADDGTGKPGAFAAVSSEVTVHAGAAPTWIEFPFPTMPSLAPGNYWLGYWVGSPAAQQAYYISAANSERYAPASYSTVSNPPDTFTANGAGGTSLSRYSLYATYAPAPAVNTVLPSISGSAVQGQTLTANTGAWDGAPTFAYQWQSCDASGASCSNIVGAVAKTYVLQPADVGLTVRVRVTGTNALGSATALSGVTSVVQGLGSSLPGTLGRTNIGDLENDGWANFIDLAGPYTLDAASQFSKLTGYLRGGAKVAPIRGVIYADSGGEPGNFVAVTAPVNIAMTQNPGWVDFPFTTPPTLQPGKYWLGYWYGEKAAVQYYNSVTNAGRYKSATYSATGNPPSPYGSAPAYNKSFSLYGSYTIPNNAPVNTVLPSVAGDNYPTATLTTTNGTWTNSPTGYAYQWRRCDSGGGNCLNISGATGQAYVQQAADVGKTIRVVVTATNAAGSGGAVSAQTPVVNDAPVNTGLPTISGTPAQGQTLTAGNGTWAGSPTGFAYQWQRCDGAGAGCSDIGSATGQTYVPVAADVAHTLRVTVTASSPAGSGSATSAQTPAIQAVPTPDVGAQPRITGQPYLNQTLTIDAGTWTPTPTGFAYQWRRCDAAGANCVDIGGAAGQTYQTQAADVGKTLRALVTATNANGSGTATTDATAPVSAAPSADLAHPPTITGQPYVTQLLTALPGTWNGSPTTYAYQWRRCPAPPASCTTPTTIGGATADTYTVQNADVGFTLQVVVTASNPAGSNVASSARTDVIQAGPANTALPSITVPDPGPIAGQTLTAADGTWSPAPTSFGHQWRRCDAGGGSCADISGATGQSYVVQNADAGSTLRVAVTGTSPGGSSVAVSPATGVVTSPPFVDPASPPTISGSTVLGATLTVDHGVWNGDPTGYGYQWKRCDSAGANCVDIAGATGTTHVIDADDVGHTIRVLVTASNTIGTGTALSAVAQAEGGSSGTIGEPTPGTSWGTGGANYLDISGPFQLPVGATVTKLTGYLAGGTNPSPLRAVLYADASGEPGALVAVTSQVTVPASAGASWVDFPFPSPLTLTGGRYWMGYWVGFPADARYYYASSGGGERYQPAPYDASANPPSPFASAGSSTNVYSLYATYQSSHVRSAPYIDVDHPPVITGTPYQGQVLSASTGTWFESPDAYAYQWRRCDGTGAACTDIGGATGTTYTLAAGDSGHTIRVVVTASNDLGAGTATSAATPLVNGGPALDPAQPPSIAGDLGLGSTLTASPGVWTGNPTSFAYQWYRCVNGGACASIVGAAAPSYTVQVADVGFSLMVQVTATSPAGSTLAESPHTALVQAAPVNTGLPALSGNAVEGQALTVSNGTWDYVPTSYAYQWSRCDAAGAGCTAIGTATSATYTLQPADVGHTVRATVTAANGYNSGSATSAASAVVHGRPTNSVLPSISGTPYVGTTLTAENGTWGESPTGFAYRWQRCNGSCVDIGGATAQTYALQALDVGKTVQVIVTATNDVGSTSATSAATATINDGPATVPGNGPSIAGTPDEGQTLTADHGQWTGTPTAYSYRWLRCENTAGGACIGIDGATAQTYVVKTADAGFRLQVEVTATSPAGSAVAYSDETAVVRAVPAIVTAPTVTGNAYVGSILSATTGSWGGAPASFAYQWRRCDASGAACTDIAGAASQTYTLQAADGGATIRVAVTATNVAGSTTATSAQTAVIGDVPTSSTLPSITGSPFVGQTLTADNGVWTGTPTGYAYQWRRCDAAGANCSDLVPFTAQTYTVVAGDAGATLRVVVRASNPAGTGTATSGPSAVVNATPANTALPSISGVTTQGETLTATNGTWAGAPTSFARQWRRCDSGGASCTDITGATGQTYVLQGADVGQTLRVVVTATNPAGSTAATSDSSAVVHGAASAPGNTSAPTITGTAAEGQALSAGNGTWSGFPVPSFAYQWRRCTAAGASCADIAGATAQSYVLRTADVGQTLRVNVTATNTSGSATAQSDPSAVVAAAGSTIGLTTVGTSTNRGGGNYIDVSGPYTLSTTADLSKLTGYLSGGSSSTQIRAVVYADNSGNPGAFAAVTAPTTIAANQAAGWVDFTFTSTPTLPAGRYWLGYWYQSTSAYEYYTSSANAGRYRSATYSSTASPPSPFGSGTTYSLAFNLYATYSGSTSPPSNTALPAVTGTATQGQTLTATTGSWVGASSYAFQWRSCDTTGASCGDIFGATSQTYTLQAGDVGATIRVKVTATNANGSAAATSSQTAVVQAAASLPVNTALPLLTGTTTQGQALTVDNGTWTSTPTSYAYQWRRCDAGGASCVDIGGATAASYTLQAADVGGTVRAMVTATNSAGSAAATSDASAVIQSLIPANTFGNPTAGATANRGGANYIDVSGPYTLSTAAQLTKLSGYLVGGSSSAPIRAVVYADNSGNPGALVAVTAPTTIPVNQPAAWVDFTFAGSPILPAGKYWLGYWYANNAAQQYFTTAAGAGRYRPATYSPTADPPSPYGSGTTYSNAYSLYASYTPSTSPPANTVAPSITGTATQGQILTVSNGTWTGASSYAYQWRSCDAAGAGCTDIAGATSQTYTLQATDVGQTVRATVTATNVNGSTPATSSQTAVIQAAASLPVNTALPVVSGTTTAGQILSTTQGSWTNSPTGYAYQWRRCDAGGAGCTDIAGATSQTYTLQATDVGQTVRAVVAASNAGGTATATSAQTGVIAAAPNGGTLGRTGIGTSSNRGGGNYIDVSGPWALTSAATATKLTGYLRGGTSSVQIRAVVYADDNGKPGAFVGVSAPTTIAASQPPGWVDFTFASPVGLAAGSYWLGYWYAATSAYEYYVNVTNGGRYRSATYSATANPPTPFGSGTTYTLSFSLYATLGPPLSPPANTSAPTITSSSSAGASGSVAADTPPAQGQALVASPGTWTNSPTAYAYHWRRCGASGDGCAAITSATARSYQPAAADVGSTLRVAVTATNAGGASTATSAATGVITGPPQKPANTSSPTITGVAASGETLTASEGAWTGSPSFSYRWQRCNSAGGNCANVKNAAAKTYVLASADVGSTIRVFITGTNAAGSLSVASPPTAVVTSATASSKPVSTTPPTISGTPAQGSTLTAGDGAWAGSPTSFAYRWRRCDASGGSCSNISNATARTYTPVTADVGSRLRVVVTAANAAGSASATSEPTAVVAPAMAKPVATAAPTISGTAMQGATLTASPGTWTGDPKTFAYRWRRCDAAGGNCQNINGAAEATYVVQKADVGVMLRVVVTATNATGSTSATSDPTRVVVAAAATAAGSPPPQGAPAAALPAGIVPD